MYATGRHTDRTLAEWLNVNEQRTARDRAFGVDTVREMLCNTAYAGYVSARRDTTKTIKGLHEPIIEETLFDRVQEMRRQRARTLKPGRPSQRYLLRGLARCERCQGKMQGTAIGRKLVRPLLLRHPPRQPHLRSASRPRRSRRGASSSSSSPTSSPRPRSATRSSAASPAAPRQTRPTPPSDAPSWRSACTAPATSTSSVTSPAPSTWRAATPSTPSWPHSRPSRSPISTRRGRYSTTSRSSGTGRQTQQPSATSSRSSSSASGWTSSASSPSSPSPHSRPSSRTRPWKPPEKRCVKSGSAGCQMGV